MTIHQAERITGLTIMADGPYFWKAKGELGEIHIRAFDEKEAAQKIVDWNWRQICATRARELGWLCERCHRLRSLQGHHKQYRSRGRMDIVSNLEMLCLECHGEEHEHGHRRTATA